MNIHKSSLIYQFLTKSVFGDNDVPTNLCPYMRSFVLRLFLTCIFYSFLTIGVVGAIFTPIYILLHGFNRVGRLDAVLGVLTGIGGAIWLVTITFGLYYISSKLYRLMRRTNPIRRSISHLYHKVTHPFNSNIFVRWLRAIHNKVCPQITFTPE